MKRLYSGVPVLLALALTLSGCTAIQQVAALSEVDFALDRIADPLVAGVDLSQVRSFNDVGLLNAARITGAVARGELPTRFVIHVAAQNPADNSVAARLVGMDWSLFLDGTQTISGSFNDPRDLPPGVPVDIPVAIELDLLQFFDQSGPDLVNLILGLAGAGGSGTDVRLEARPSIDTPIGPIRYPRPVNIIKKQVGG